jgi:hypothetical protein
MTPGPFIQVPAPVITEPKPEESANSEPEPEVIDPYQHEPRYFTD